LRGQSTRGTRLSRFIAGSPQLAEERPEEPKPPREVEPDEPHDFEERVDEVLDERDEDEPVLRPQPQPEPVDRCTVPGP
jgi:hypothetical protein